MAGFGQEVHVVSVGPLLRGAVVAVLAGAGFRSQAFATLTEQGLIKPPATATLVVDLDGLGPEPLHVLAPIVERGNPILALASRPRPADARSVLSSGIRGYLGRDCPESELISAVTCVARGGRHIEETIMGELTELLLAEPVRPTGFLTPRERQVMGLAAEGRTTAEMAAVMFVSPATAKAHLRKAYGKLGARNRSAAVAQLARMEERRPVAQLV